MNVGGHPALEFTSRLAGAGDVSASPMTFTTIWYDANGITIDIIDYT